MTVAMDGQSTMVFRYDHLHFLLQPYECWQQIHHAMIFTDIEILFRVLRYDWEEIMSLEVVASGITWWIPSQALIAVYDLMVNTSAQHNNQGK